MLGLAGVESYEKVSGSREEIPVNVPQVQSNSPIIIKLCPETGKSYVEDGNIYFNKEKEINCTPGGGGG
jgi:hypothetical protein